MFRQFGRFAPLVLCLFAIVIAMGSCGPPKQTDTNIYSQGTDVRIPYEVPKTAAVTITIYDPNGTLVRKLELGQKTAGTYKSRERAAHWDGRNARGKLVPRGTYSYTLTAGEFSVLRKIVHNPYHEAFAEEMSAKIKAELEDRRKRTKQESEE